MTRRQTLTAALSPLFAPLLAWLPGRRAERKAVEPVKQWMGFVSDEPEFSCFEVWDDSGHWVLADNTLREGDPVCLTAAGALKAWAPGDEGSPIGVCDEPNGPHGAYEVIRSEPQP